jgi:hypothetical protein
MERYFDILRGIFLAAFECFREYGQSIGLSAEGKENGTSPIL